MNTWQYNMGQYSMGQYNMAAISYNAAKVNLTNILANACNNHAAIITTRNSKAPVVMSSLEAFNAMQETTCLLRSPANASNFFEFIAEFTVGNETKRAVHFSYEQLFGA